MDAVEARAGRDGGPAAQRFLPASERRRASYDGPLDIGHGQTNSQPRTVSSMLELLDVRPGHRVLDVGSGSGWTTALLAELVGPTGSVLGPRAGARPGRSPVARTSRRPGCRGLASAPSVAGVLGAPDEGPFDRILVSAMATRLPLELVAQLEVHGILVVPVGGRMVRVVRDDTAPDGRRLSEHGHYRFVPLVTD